MSDTSSLATVHLSVELPDSPPPRSSGTLVLSWLTGAEADRFRQQGHADPASICPIVERALSFVLESAVLLAGMEIELTVPGEAENVYPIAIFDQMGSLWSSLMGSGRGNLLGLASQPVRENSASVVLRIEVRAEPAVPPYRVDAARFQHRLVTESGGEDRRICVYLPPDYADGVERRHPVVYLLPGLGGDEHVRFQDRTLMSAADDIADKSRSGVILVGVNARTLFGSWYLSGRETPWLRFLTRDLIDAVDKDFHTLAEPEHRVLIGQSTGGFNAIQIALTRPGVFGAVGASAPDALDMEYWLLRPDGAIKPQWLAWMRLEETAQGIGQMLSYARSWSPTSSGGYLWPVDLAGGEINPDVLDGWLAQSPLRLLDHPRAQAALRALRGRLFIRSSTKDEFGLFDPAQRFAQRLDELRIDHRFVVQESGHFDAQSQIADLMCAALAPL